MKRRFDTPAWALSFEGHTLVEENSIAAEHCSAANNAIA